MDSIAVIARNLPYLLAGLPITLAMAAVGILGSFILGCVLACLRMAPYLALRVIAKAYIELVRSIPLLLFIFFTYFIIAGIGYNVTAFATGCVVFTCFTGAYIAEIIRSGIASMHPGYSDAAKATGMNYIQTMRYVVLPLAVRQMVPAIASEFIMLIKETSLTTVIGVQEFYTRISITNARTLTHAAELLGFAAIVYFIVCYGLSIISRKFEYRADM